MHMHTYVHGNIIVSFLLKADSMIVSVSIIVRLHWGCDSAAKTKPFKPFNDKMK